MQNPVRFRIADNVYQTRDGQMVPVAGSASYLDLTSPLDSVKNIFRYNNAPFILGYASSVYAAYNNSSTLIPSPPLPAEYGSFGVQAIEKLGNLYLNIPSKGLYKYDGYQMYRAGTPWAYADPTTTVTGFPTINAYVRLIQHHIDQQGNVVHSGYTQFPSMALQGDAPVPTYHTLNLRTDKGATDYPNSAIRPALEVASLANDFFSYFIYATSYTNPSTNVFVMTTGGQHNVNVGQYLMPTSDEFASESYPNGLAWKVTATTATTVTIGNPRIYSYEDKWENYTGTVTAWATPVSFTNYWISAWTSSAETGAYAHQGTVPAMYESAANRTYTIQVTTDPDLPSDELDFSNIFNLAPIMGDFYDVTTSKQVFPLTATLLPLSFGTYGDLVTLAYSNEVYFSDTTLGGSFEMTSGLAFFVAGEGDDGNIQAVAGTSDFMFISRQFKNYYLTGNLVTANYRVSEISETSMGAYSNESAYAISDKIIFLNKQGVWSVSGGGRCEEVSFNIRGLFANFSSTTSFSEEDFFDLDSFPDYATSSTSNQFLRIRVDVNRNLMIFAIRDPDTTRGQGLVLNLNNGEFYTWSRFIPSGTTPDFQDINFMQGFYWFTHNTSTNQSVYKETAGSFGYMATYPSRLAQSWFTAGEPSLEKKLNQLKMWGLMTDQTVGITHKLDWRDSTEVTDDSYVSSDNTNFSHKTRLKPANFQSVSVAMSFTNNFQIEGMEVEWQPLQLGMKR